MTKEMAQMLVDWASERLQGYLLKELKLDLPVELVTLQAVYIQLKGLELVEKAEAHFPGYKEEMRRAVITAVKNLDQLAEKSGKDVLLQLLLKAMPKERLAEACDQVKCAGCDSREECPLYAQMQEQVH